MAVLPVAVDMVTYLNGVMHFTIADAVNILTNFMGTTYTLSILVAFLADTYFGRYKAVTICATLEFLGLGLLTVQAHFSKFKPQECNIHDPVTSHLCKKVDGGNTVLLFFALYLVAAGSAGLKAGLPPHGADQFDEKDPKEAKQLSSFFNWLFLAVCLGSAVGLTFIVWIHHNVGSDYGFGISAVLIFLGLIIFGLGLPLYRFPVVQGTTAITEIVQVYVASIRNRKSRLPENPEELYEIERNKKADVELEFLPHRDTFRFLDKAAIQTSSPKFDESNLKHQINPWKLCRVTQVENAKIILGMVPIFGCTIILSTGLAQLQTFSIQQGLTMDTSITKTFHIPPASLPIIPFAFMIILTPLYDRIFVPFAKKFTGHPTGITHLQRIGVGLVLSAISMGTAALMEVKRKAVARNHNMLDAIPNLQPLPISVFWLSFQYFIYGIADMFTFTGLLQFFYSEAPKGLKSIATCFVWSSMGLGFYLSTILVKLVNGATKGITNSGGWLAGNNINRNHLNLFYWLLSILSLLNFFNYLFWANRYQYRLIPSVAKKEIKVGMNKD